jgi:hypothetical protein
MLGDGTGGFGTAKPEYGQPTALLLSPVISIRTASQTSRWSPGAKNKISVFLGNGSGSFGNSHSDNDGGVC